jgi:hypothetical protein
MQVDFGQAARRHYQDASQLKKDRRLHNADHLFGLAAECALKALMVASGARTDARGDLLERSHRKHFNDGLWDEFHVFASGRQRQRYLSRLPPENPYMDWHVDQRYAADREFMPAAVEAHAKGARATMAALECAAADGGLAC